VALISLTRDAVAIVDDADFEWLNSYSWSAVPRYRTSSAVRKGRAGTGEPRTVAMHRQILGFPTGFQIDHINGNALDNRRGNLRLAVAQTNSFNRPKPKVASTSKFKGVLQRKGKTTWEARVKYDDKAIHLGTFADEEDAAAAYNYGALLMFGDYARPNLGVREAPPDIRAMVYDRCLAQVVKRRLRPSAGAFSDRFRNEAVFLYP